jgi:hypothetical protein
MAKKATSQTDQQGADSAAGGSTTTRSGSIQGYFRQLFRENPKLLKERSNEKIFQRWLEDHPGETEVPERVKSGLFNLKSLLRKKLKSRGRRKAEQASEAETAPAEPVVPEENPLEVLELQIDEVLTLAKSMDREALHEVIGHLRAARNHVVRKIEQ